MIIRPTRRIGFVSHDTPSSHPAAPEIGFVLHVLPTPLVPPALCRPAPPEIGFVLHICLPHGWQRQGFGPIRCAQGRLLAMVFPARL